MIEPSAGSRSASATHLVDLRRDLHRHPELRFEEHRTADDVFPGAITVSPDVGDVTGRSAALYAFDTVTVGDRWELTGGLRYDHFEAEGVATPPAPVEQTADMLSFRLGAVYKPRPNGSVYAAYGNSLNPSLEGLSYGTANTAIDPEKTYTFEVGTKWDIVDERLALTAAAFRIDKTNARTPGLLPDDPPQVLEGRQRVDGVELAVTGGITSRWKVFAVTRTWTAGWRSRTTRSRWATRSPTRRKTGSPCGPRGRRRGGWRWPAGRATPAAAMPTPPPTGTWTVIGSSTPWRRSR